MKKILALIALIGFSAHAQEISSFTSTNKVSYQDRIPITDTNRGAGARTLVLTGTNALPALLAVGTLGGSTAAPEVTLSRQSNAVSGVAVAVVNSTNVNLYSRFATSTNVVWLAGIGSPESAITAGVGSMYSRIDGSAQGTHLYIKTNGTSNTGWWGAQ